jgi:hypothetical protein
MSNCFFILGNRAPLRLFIPNCPLPKIAWPQRAAAMFTIAIIVITLENNELSITSLRA